jgi:hypothetical protein
LTAAEDELELATTPFWKGSVSAAIVEGFREIAKDKERINNG